MSMRAEIDAYLQHGQVEGWSPITVRLYGRYLGDLLTFLRRRGCRRVPDVTPSDLDVSG
jgi:site-specific recombinase XerC